MYHKLDSRSVIQFELSNLIMHRRQIIDEEQWSLRVGILCSVYITFWSFDVIDCCLCLLSEENQHRSQIRSYSRVSSRSFWLSTEDPDGKVVISIFTALHGMQTRSAMGILSVRPSVCPSVCIVTKRKKDLYSFLYHTKDHLS